MIFRGLNPKERLDPSEMRHANIPDDFWRARVADIPDNYSCKPRISWYTESILDHLMGGIGLLLHGPKGHGKTYAAAAILKVAIGHHASALFLEMDRIGETFIERGRCEFEEEEKTLLERARTADLLALDDLGAEHISRSGFSIRALEALCRYRLHRRRSTILTTNLALTKPGSPDNLDRVYGDWVVSVLKGKVIPLHVHGIDWREKQHQDLMKRAGGN
jgi:DNA replication protein DnaC